MGPRGLGQRPARAGGLAFLVLALPRAAGHQQAPSPTDDDVGPVIRISDPFPFQNLPASLGVLWANRISQDGFSCESVDEGLAVEGSSVATRRLNLALPSSYPQLFMASQGQVPSVGGLAATAVPEEGLTVEVDPVMGVGTSLELSSNGAELSVRYDCSSPGISRVFLRWTYNQGGSQSPGCISWMKRCATGFAGLFIEEGNKGAVVNGVVVAEWQRQMLEQGIFTSSTVLQLSYPDGVLRLQPPHATADQRFLQVDLRGPFLLGGDDTPFEVTQQPAPLTVLYTCDHSGMAEVSLALTKHRLGVSRQSPEQIHLRWRKHCGLPAYPSLQVMVKSTTYENKTAAIQKGEIQPLFKGLCDAVTDGAPLDECLTIPASDGKTTLEVSVGDDVPLPELDPLPIVTVDPSVMKVFVSKARDQPRSGGKGAVRTVRVKDMATVDVKYVCLKDAVTNVLVTLHMVAHKPIDISWIKACKKPRSRVGRAFTAKQAITIGLIVVATTCAISFACLFFCDDSDRPGTVDGRPKKRRGPDFDWELDNISDAPQGGK